MAINSSDADSPAPGFPFVNYAQRDRNMNTDSRPLSIPRFKYTYLVEFHVNPVVLQDPLTNIREFEKNGRIYTHLKTIDHPVIKTAVETLRSYNKYIKVPTKMEYEPAKMVFDDDSTSVVQTLWKEYENFYTHAASVGQNVAVGNVTNLGSLNEVGSFQLLDTLVGDEVRQNMDIRPSLGLKLKPNTKRHFFDSIVIYDLGTEPGGINVWWFHRPIITSWEPGPLEKEDRTGKSEVNVSFEYEGYYFVTGQNRSKIRDFMLRILDFVPPDSVDFNLSDPDAIGQQLQVASDEPVDSASRIGSYTPTANPTGVLAADPGLVDPTWSPEEAANAPRFVPGLEDQIAASNTRRSLTDAVDGAADEKEAIENSIARIENEISEAEQNPNTSDAKLDRLERQRRELASKGELVDEQLNTARKKLDSFNQKERSVPATRSALNNTKNQSGLSPESPSGTVPNAANPKKVTDLQMAQTRLQQNINGAQTSIDTDLTDLNRAAAVGEISETEYNLNLEKLRARQGSVAADQVRLAVVDAELNKLT